MAIPKDPILYPCTSQLEAIASSISNTQVRLSKTVKPEERRDKLILSGFNYVHVRVYPSGQGISLEGRLSGYSTKPTDTLMSACLSICLAFMGVLVNMDIKLYKKRETTDNSGFSGSVLHIVTRYD